MSMLKCQIVGKINVSGEKFPLHILTIEGAHFLACLAGLIPCRDLHDALSRATNIAKGEGMVTKAGGYTTVMGVSESIEGVLC